VSGAPSPERSLAFVMWGDLFEDFFRTIDVDLDRFRESLTGGWLFGYVEALATAGVRTTLLHVSAEVSAPLRFIHEPTGTPVTILPAPRRHRWLRALHRRFRHRKALSSLASYGSVPLRALTRELRRCRAEAILTQEYEHARFDVLVLLGRLLHLPVYASFQGGDAPHSRLERLIRPVSVRNCAGLIIASSRERRRVHHAYRLPDERVAPIPNAMDVDAVAPLTREEARRVLDIDQETRVVEWHGRVTIRRKGLDVLLEAWDEVCRRRPGQDLLLLLVGTGQDADEFARRLAATGLSSVRWRSEYVSDRVELLTYQSAADIFVLPSRHEGFPVAPIEAMTVGLPVVAADAPGVADIFSDGESSGGIVVPREDAAALAEALGNLIDDRDRCLAMGRHARAAVEARFALEPVGAQLATFLFPAGR
jgi:glycosyltransferase involved in cell wall biosynthesis